MFKKIDVNNPGDLIDLLKMLAEATSKRQDDEDTDTRVMGTIDPETRSVLEAAKDQVKLAEKRADRRMNQIQIQMLQMRDEFEEQFIEPLEAAKNEYRKVWDSIKRSMGISVKAHCSLDADTNEVLEHIPRIGPDLH